MLEQDLIAAARSGCADSFSALMKSHQDRLYRFLMVRSSCMADAQDALQDTFLIAYRSLHTYRSKWAFSTWLYRIALRELARVSNRHEVTGMAQVSESEVCWIGDLDQGNLWREVKANLPARQFDVVWLMYAEGFTVRSVAQTLERSIPWVKMAAYRARARLARTLDAEWRDFGTPSVLENRPG